MALFSTLRSRRFAVNQTETSQQIIVFRLRQEWFALPILTVQKVVPLGRVYGDPQGTGISVTNYEGQEIMVVDVGKRIFNDTKTPQYLSLQPENLDKLAEKSDPEPTKAAAPTLFDFTKFEEEEQRYLIVINQENEDLIGLPIDSKPVMHRVANSAFKSLPKGYLAQGNIQCVSSTMIEISNHPPIFILDRQQLNQPNKIIPSGN